MDSTYDRDATANYMHGSIYHYDATAVSHVKATLEETAVQNGISKEQISLHYDYKAHLFILSCPSTLGAQLDDWLGQILLSTIPKQSEGVEGSQEDGHGIVRRFEESIPQQFINPRDTLAAEEDAKEEEAVKDEAAQDSIDLPAFQFVMPPSKKRRKLQMMRVADLDRPLRKSMSYGMKFFGAPLDKESFRARIVRYNHDEDEWEYVACAGEVPEELNLEIYQVFREAVRPPIVEEPQIQSIEQLNQDTVHQWDYVGSRPTMQQWLAGMGETKVLPHDTEPELPPVEAQDIEEPRLALLATGDKSASKTRAPAGDDNDHSDDSHSPPLDITALLRRPTVPASSDKPPPHKDTKALDDELKEGDSDDGTVIDLADLLRSKTGLASSIQPLQSAASRETSPLWKDVQAELAPQNANYNRVDIFGLKGNAEHRARFDLQNELAALSLAGDNAGDGWQLSGSATPAKNTVASSSTRAAWVSPVRYNASVLGEPSWTRKVVQPTAATTSTDLVGLELSDRTAWPLILQQPRKVHKKDRIDEVHQPSHDGTLSKPSSSAMTGAISVQHDEEDLIDLSDSPAPVQTPVERLRSLSPYDQAQMHKTMRQKASRQGRGHTEDPTALQYMISEMPAFHRIQITTGLIFARGLSGLERLPWHKVFDPDELAEVLNKHHSQLKFFDGRLRTKQAAAVHGMSFAQHGVVDVVPLSSQQLIILTMRDPTGHDYIFEVDPRDTNKVKRCCSVRGSIWVHAAELAWDARICFHAKRGLERTADIPSEDLQLVIRSITFAPEFGHSSFLVNIGCDEGGEPIFTLVSAKIIRRFTRFVIWSIVLDDSDPDPSPTTQVSFDFNMELVADLIIQRRNNIPSATLPTPTAEWLCLHDSPAQLKSDLRLWWQSSIVMDETRDSLDPDNDPTKLRLIMALIKHVGKRMGAITMPSLPPVPTLASQAMTEAPQSLW